MARWHCKYTFVLNISSHGVTSLGEEICLQVRLLEIAVNIRACTHRLTLSSPKKGKGAQSPPPPRAFYKNFDFKAQITLLFPNFSDLSDPRFYLSDRSDRDSSKNFNGNHFQRCQRSQRSKLTRCEFTHLMTFGILVLLEIIQHSTGLIFFSLVYSLKWLSNEVHLPILLISWREYRSI